MPRSWPSEEVSGLEDGRNTGTCAARCAEVEKEGK